MRDHDHDPVNHHHHHDHDHVSAGHPALAVDPLHVAKPTLVRNIEEERSPRPEAHLLNRFANPLLSYASISKLPPRLSVGESVGRSFELALVTFEYCVVLSHFRAY